MTSLEGITLGTKLKMPFFTLYLPHNFQRRVFGVSKVYVTGIQIQIKLTNISVSKVWPDLKVNPQINKVLNP